MARLRRESSRSYSGRPVLSGTAVTPGTAIREGCCGSTGVSRGHSTGSHEPVNTPEGLTTREGLNLAGRTRPSVVLFPVRRRRQAEHWAAIIGAEKEWLLYPSGLPGTAGRGPACPVVWEPGGETLRATRCAPDMGVNWKGGSPFVWEHGCPAVLHGQQDGVNTRARQLPDREAWWEGSLTQT